MGIHLILPKRGSDLEDIDSALCLCDPSEPHIVTRGMQGMGGGGMDTVILVIVGPVTQGPSTDALVGLSCFPST